MSGFGLSALKSNWGIAGSLWQDSQIPTPRNTDCFDRAPVLLTNIKMSKGKTSKWLIAKVMLLSWPKKLLIKHWKFSDKFLAQVCKTATLVIASLCAVVLSYFTCHCEMTGSTIQRSTIWNTYLCTSGLPCCKAF